MGATLFKVGAVWHYRFQVAGLRVQRSTRESRKGRAQEIADRAYDAAVIESNGGKPVPTLRELVNKWLETQRPISSSHHVASVERFQRLHMFDLGDTPISMITTEDVERARIEYLCTRKPASANHWLRILKLLFMWAVRRGMIKSRPWQVAELKVQKKPRPTMPLDVTREWLHEVDKASAGAPGTGTAVRLMFGLGLREGESISARWEWFDWERDTYTPGVTKGKEADPLPVPAWLRAYLAPLRRPEGLVAAKPDGWPFKPGFARYAMKKANAACGIVGITPHRLRGSFATLLSASVPIQDVQRVMRHKSHNTTMGYLEKNLSMVAQAQQRIAEKAQLGGEKVANGTAESL